MAEYCVISKERHAGKTWQRPPNYAFAAKDAVAPLVAHELPRAMASMGLGFIESSGVYTLVAVQGLRQGQNKFVSRDGRWVGDYIPATYRTYPFRLGRNPDGIDILCIDETAAQVSENRNGEAFFLLDGTPAPALTQAFQLLVELEKDRLKTQKACDALARHDLLEPWLLRANDGDKVLEAAGLFRVAEAKLYALDPAALAEVRDNSGLMIAFAQLFSMHQVHMMGKPGAQTRSVQEAPVINLREENGLISFANL